MPNPRLAARYAKSLVSLSQEQGNLEAVYADMSYLWAVCKQSHEFVNLLRSPIIKADQKGKIMDAVTHGKIGALTEGFITLLIKKGRESDLPEIAHAVVEQYHEIKGIHLVKLTTAAPVGESVKQYIEQKVKKEKGLGTVQLETVVDEKIIGGFMLEMDNQLLDASILRDLKDIKRQFDKNLFVHNIR
ncbi:MAG: ATP synthase F1 subunit delta [Bacteroidetes bacterium]|nr:ATP synthase F1 subunit delta [Bacteroidota bacterium]